MSDEKNVTPDDTGDKEAKDKAQNVNTDAKSDHMIPKARFDEVNLKRKAVADELKGDVPDDFKDLIPDLPPGELIKWLRKSTAKGLFSQKQAESGPDSERPGGKPPQDLTDMSPHDLRKAGYKQ